MVSLTIAVAMMLPASSIAQVPTTERPSITVTSFEYSTVASQVSGDRRTRGHLEHAGVYDGNAFAEHLGNGAADLVVQKLVESDRFRVFERHQLEAVQREQHLQRDSSDDIERARYVVTGSVTRVGLNERNVGGLAGGLGLTRILGHLALLGVNTSSTTVHLTARVVDTRSGEIIGSFTAEGESKKRWGITAFGAATGGFGGARAQDVNFRETAVGEATTRAASALVDQVIALRATRLRP